MKSTPSTRQIYTRGYADAYFCINFNIGLFGDDCVIIRLNKLHAVLLALGLIVSTFIFALCAEKKTTAVSSQNTRMLPIVMYHHITQKPSRAGDYVIKTSELEQDFDYLKDKGYKAVTVQDLIDYVDGKKDLPEKIIMITFDDGFESVYSLAWPMLAERKMCAVAAAVGTITESYTQSGDKNINYAYMTWDELAEIDKSDEFEVQNHSYDMHHTGSGKRKGLSKMNGESVEEYNKILTQDLTKMQNSLKNNSGILATAAVYPYGAYSPSTLETVKKIGFRCSMTCEQRINSISRANADCLYNLGRFNRPSGIATKDFFKKLGIED